MMDFAALFLSTIMKATDIARDELGLTERQAQTFIGSIGYLVDYISPERTPAIFKFRAVINCFNAVMNTSLQGCDVEPIIIIEGVDDDLLTHASETYMDEFNMPFNVSRAMISLFSTQLFMTADIFNIPLSDFGDGFYDLLYSSDELKGEWSARAN